MLRAQSQNTTIAKPCSGPSLLAAVKLPTPPIHKQWPPEMMPLLFRANRSTDTVVATIRFYKTTGTVVAQGSPPGVLCFTVVRPQLHLRAMDGHCPNARCPNCSGSQGRSTHSRCRVLAVALPGHRAIRSPWLRGSVISPFISSMASVCTLAGSAWA